MKKRLSRKLISVLLVCVLLCSALPMAGLTAYAAELDTAETGAEPEFGSVVYPTDGAGLKTILESDGNIKIELNKDIEYRIGTKGDYNAQRVEYWCTLGKGTKVIDLKGHNIKLMNDRQQDDLMTMFRIPASAEMVINDSTGNNGEINYDGLLGLADVRFKGLSQRDLFEVSGKLTVNSGNLIAGRSLKSYYSTDATYYYRQINGNAIHMLKDSEVCVNGGTVKGRGFAYPWAKYDRCSAIYAEGGKLTITDGEFWGMGCANVLRIVKGVEDVTIYAGVFDTHKQDYDIAINSSSTEVQSVKTASYGYTGIPAMATSKNLLTTTFEKDGKPMTSDERLQGAATVTTNRIEVYPVDQQFSPFFYGTKTELNKSNRQHVTIEWDKKSRLVVGINQDLYFPAHRSFDEIWQHYYYNGVTISKSPWGSAVSSKLKDFTGAANYTPSTAFSSNYCVDLNDLSDSAKDELKVGNTYYIQLKGYEIYNQRTLKYNPEVHINLKIVEPDESIPDFDMDLNIKQDWNTSTKTSSMNIYPEFGNYSLPYMKSIGMFDTMKQSFIYLNTEGTPTTKTYPEGMLSNFVCDDSLHGANYIRYQLTLTKGSYSETREVAKWAASFPCMTASVTPDSSNRYYVDLDSDSKWLTLYSNTNNPDGMFWAKDGVKIAGSDKAKQWMVDVSTANGIGWYALGYNVNGEDVISEQQIYIGVKGGDRSLNYQLSSKTCSITADGDSTPTITIIPRGNGWSKITEYNWQVLSVPEGFFYTKKRKMTKATVSLAEILGRSGNESSFYQGDYKMQCTVTDAYGNKMTTEVITITVMRPPTGLALSTYIDGYDVDVTDGFVVMAATDDWRRLSANFTPEYSVQESGYNVTYTSSNPFVATVDQEGFLAAQGVGSATIAARYKNYYASTTVYVPKTSYELNIPESWLTPVAGEAVHRGSIGEYEDFTVELVWNVKGSYGDYEYKEETFVGNREYYPTVRIYPNEGICYPVNIEKPYNGRTDYLVDTDRYEITINGVTYYGADYCDREVFYNSPPLSQGSERYDWFQLDLESTGFLIDPNDEYLNLVFFSVETPTAGDTVKQVDETNVLPISFEDEGLIHNSFVSHITDLDTISDYDFTNDAREEFTTYEAGETYRLYMNIFTDYSYRNQNGGRVYFTNNVLAYDYENWTITDNSSADVGYLAAVVYFTVPEEEEKTYLIGDVNFDGKVDVLDAALVQKHASGKSVLNSEQLEVADVNNDGHVDVLDAAQIQKYAAGIISEFDKKA